MSTYLHMGFNVELHKNSFSSHIPAVLLLVIISLIILSDDETLKRLIVEFLLYDNANNDFDS